MHFFTPRIAFRSQQWHLSSMRKGKSERYFPLIETWKDRFAQIIALALPFPFAYSFGLLTWNVHWYFFSHCVVYIFPACFCYITLQREHLTISPLQSGAPFASSILTWWYKRLISSWLANVIKTSQSPQFPWPTGTSQIFFFYGCTPCLNWIMKGCYFSCTMKMKSVFLLSLFFWLPPLRNYPIWKRQTCK